MSKSTRNSRILLTAFGASAFGNWIYRMAVPVVILQSSGSATGAAIAYALEFVPFIVLGPFGGVIADRFPKKRTLIRLDVIAAALVAVLTALVVAGLTQMWLLLPLTFLISCVPPLYYPTFQAALPEYARREELAKANATYQLIDSTFSVLGPVLGTGLIVTIGAAAAITLNALTFAVSAAILTLIPHVARPDTTDNATPQAAPVLREVIDGLRYLRRNALMWSGSWIMAISSLGLMVLEANLFYFLIEAHQQPVASVGFVFSAYGVGSLIGAVAAVRLRKTRAAGPVMSSSLLIAAAATALFGAIDSVLWYCMTWGLVGMAITCLAVTWTTLRQLAVPGQLLGRTIATSRTLTYLTIPIGAWIGSTIISQGADAGTWLPWAGGGIQLLGVALCAFGVMGHAQWPRSEANEAEGSR